MYRVWRPTNNCPQIASKCTNSHREFQKFSGVISPDPEPNWENEKVAALVNSLDVSLSYKFLTVLWAGPADGVLKLTRSVRCAASQAQNFLTAEIC